MEFHISRAAREDLDLDDLLFSYTGNVVFANLAASRKLAARLNALPSSPGSAQPAADATVNAGALFAMGLIDELSHALVARYRREIDPAVLSEALRWFQAQLETRPAGSSQTGPRDSAALDRLLLTFTQQFPNLAVYRGQLTAAQWLAASTEGRPNREAALEELLLLWLANSNPAFAPFRRLFEDTPLRAATPYPAVAAAFPSYFATRPPFDPQVGSLVDALRAPFLASPDSLTGQLEFIREHWSPYLGEDLRRLLLAIDTLREEDIAIWLRFHPPGPDQFRHGAPASGSQGFVGDEFVGFDDDFRRKRRYGAGYQAPLDEYEAFSADQAWMPNVVLMAKSTYVWLEQLSRKYRRHIHRLDHIPDEELHLLAGRGITGLWLIGLWERSTASRTIKRLRGHHDAVASAYSLKDYNIAEDLGGWQAYDDLKHRAARAGLRLASDMVPNHMGIDSPWVIDHPDWFIHRWESPFPAYSFNGPDLSTDSRVEIKIDDHYYDQTDAAVAFRLRRHASGETRFVYHGNDGTTFAWNDTAQLDYSKAYVREHVIQVILHVARLFPIIRFDAAMVLAKRHVQRLWFPLPGAGGSIPSRAESAMSQEEFDALMPHEFWREVVDRVAAEVPGTLLLAEAFWMLEGYFVRTLGMHRVYNSAFMNMLRDEENAKYRSYLKKTIEFDPDILKRYVNFMSNPDERTAIDQFGDGDKCFGVATLMATLPGLPMFGHGQIEGFTERYGMEYKTAKMDEWPNEGLVARHQREIAPLLKRRWIFAGSSNFTLYDFWTGYGTVNENVFAYSNRCDGERSLVLYNNKYEAADGAIHTSAAFMDKGAGELRQRTLASGLDLPTDDSAVLSWRDPARNLEYLRRARDLRDHGLHVSLHGFQCVVLVDWRILYSSTEYPWDHLCDTLHGAGVPSLDHALTLLRLRPLHDALGAALAPEFLRILAGRALPPASTSAADRDGAPAAAPTPAAPSTQDDRLRGIVEAGQIFFERLLATLPPEDRAHLAPGSSAQSSTAPIPAAPPPDTPAAAPAKTTGVAASSAQPAAIQPAAIEPPYKERLLANLRAALRLPGPAPAPAPAPQAAAGLASAPAPGLPPGRVWPQLLAWLLLRSLPAAAGPVALFDRLQLRHALAAIFESLGFHGEDRWQAAARVRILLTPAAARPNAIRSAQPLHDPDVRWLTGVNASGSETWFNQEQFEDLAAWLELPGRLAAATAPLASQSPASSAEPSPALATESTAAGACRAAAAAGYNLDRYLASALEPAPASRAAT